MLTPVDKYVIAKIKEMRIEKGITQPALANALDLSYGFIGKIESGKYGKKYSVAQLNDLAKLFKCSIKDFFPDKPM